MASRDGDSDSSADFSGYTSDSSYERAREQREDEGGPYPYRYEPRRPQRAEREEAEEDEEENSERLNNANWYAIVFFICP